MLSALRVEDAATSVTVDVRTYASPRARVARLDVLDDQHDHHPSHRHPRGGVVLRRSIARDDEETRIERGVHAVETALGGHHARAHTTGTHVRPRARSIDILF